MTLRTTVQHGSVAELHALEIPQVEDRELWVMTPTDRAVVLGSSQDSAVVDRGVLDTDGWELVRRRSGGGAVLVDEHSLWFDVIVPRSDPEWSEDVSRSFWWLGDRLVDVLGEFGLDAAVHRGAYERTEASTLVCFAGLGPGEVIVDGRKIVGLSQRRTRHAARFQVSILRRWSADAWTGLLTGVDPATHRAIATAAVGVDDLLPSAPSNDLLLERIAAALTG